MPRPKLGWQTTVNSLDSNVVLRYLLNDIPSQTFKSKKVITSSTVYVTDVVITEVIFVLERVIGMQRLDIVRLVKAFLSLPNMIYNDYFLDQTLDLYRSKPSLSIVDCYAATEAKMYGNSLVTFDKQLVKHGGKHIKE